MKLLNSTQTPRFAGPPATAQAGAHPRFAKGPEPGDLVTLSAQAAEHQKTLALALLEKVAAAAKAVAPQAVNGKVLGSVRSNNPQNAHSTSIPQYTIPFGDKGKLTVGFKMDKDSSRRSGVETASYTAKYTLAELFFKTAQAEVTLPLNFVLYDHQEFANRGLDDTIQTPVNHYAPARPDQPDPKRRFPDIPSFLLAPTDETYKALDLKRLAPTTFAYSATQKPDLSFSRKNAQLAQSALATLAEAFQTLQGKEQAATSQKIQERSDKRTGQAVAKKEAILGLVELPV